MQSSEELHSWLVKWQPKILNNHERRLVILGGDSAWQVSVAEAFHNFYQQRGKTFLWGKDKPFIKGTLSNYRHQLGREYHLVIFDDENFHPDAFAALSGTIKAGGIMLWLKPKVLPQTAFYHRLLNRFTHQASVIWLTPEQLTSPSAFEPIMNPVVKIPDELSPEITEEQREAVTAICRVAKGHRNRPLLLTADRGRGKSSALAIASAKLIKEAKQQQALSIIVCAPSLQSLSIYFSQLLASCPQGSLLKDSFSFQQHQVRFLPIDRLLIEKPTCHLLLVDEAAGIPVHLLVDVARHFHRVVYSSTQHGYEGAGRGFAIKFQQQLNSIAPQFSRYHMHQPIRWRVNDPLESLTFDAFLFDCQQAETAANINLQTLTFTVVNQQMLANDELLLKQVFAVLVSAHYQTSPSDLKLLLDNSAVRIFIASDSSNKNVVAVALVVEEGRANDKDVEALINHEKQLRNQFIPQYLIRHLCVSDAFSYQYWRISRIAVSEHYQGQGIGARLVNFIELNASNEQVDCLATSFAANQQIVAFWQQRSFKAINLGFSKDQASGEHAVIMLKALNDNAVKLAHRLVTQFYRKFCFHICGSLKDIRPSLIHQLLQNPECHGLPAIQNIDLEIVASFTQQKMQYQQCAFSIQVYLLHQLSKYTIEQLVGIANKSLFSADSQAIAFLVAKGIQQYSDDELVREFALTGKKQIQQQMQLLLAYFTTTS